MNDLWPKIGEFALVLLLFAIVAGMVFNVTKKFQTVASEQEASVMSIMDNLDATKLALLDDAEVKGSVVIATVEKMKGSDLAVLVATLAQNSGTIDPTQSVICTNYNTGLGANATAIDSSTDLLAAWGTNNTLTTDGSDEYNMTGRVKTASGDDSVLHVEQKQNNSYREMYNKSSKYYVNPTGSFKCEIIINENNQIVGVQCKQVR